jgi:hypothetical protein
MQMIHANGVANGGEYDWLNAGDPSNELTEEFERLSHISVEDLI